MQRTDFYNKITVNNIEEYDLLDNNVSKFKLAYPVSYYRITEADMMRPDAISYRLYGSEEYWWIICMINGIEDVFHDMQVGDLIQIPNILDIFTFYKQWSVR